MYNSYELICERASIDDNFFKDFKNNPIYNAILEHVSYELGMEYYNLIRENFSLDDTIFKKFMENDIIGNPKKFKYENIFISPTTLRYIYTGLDICKKINIENMNIVEIGGGYGGQYKILYDIQEIIGKSFKKYTIVDLPNVIKLQKRYLTKLGYMKNNINFVNFYELEKCEYDLCVSNYGFGEFTKNIQDIYVDKIISRVNHYYIIYNTETIHDFLLNVPYEIENPKTGPFNKLFYK